MAAPQPAPAVVDIRPLVGRVRAATLASIVAMLAMASLESDPFFYVIALFLVVIPSVLILLLVPGKRGLGWARVTGLISVLLWGTVFTIATFGTGKGDRMIWIVRLAAAVLLIAQAVLLHSAGRIWRARRGQGELTGSLLGASVFPAFYVLFFWLLLPAAIAVPSLLRSRTAANQASAVGSLRSINFAVQTYSHEHKSAPPDIQSMRGLLDDTLACAAPPCLKSGYRFSYTLTGAGQYHAMARPIKFNETGSRSFYTDQTGVIRFTLEDRAATAKDEPVQ